MERDDSRDGGGQAQQTDDDTDRSANPGSQPAQHSHARNSNQGKRSAAGDSAKYAQPGQESPWAARARCRAHRCTPAVAVVSGTVVSAAPRAPPNASQNPAHKKTP